MNQSVPLSGDGHAVLQNAYASRDFLGTFGDTERASYNGSIEASQASDVGSIPIARSINLQNSR
jgi:hypothetical protein